uniref:Uncharacterized protein n=1 Tax=Panagrellus redivivus TaxID=6233 RepID=A0A7E4W1Z4_PANRE
MYSPSSTSTSSPSSDRRSSSLYRRKLPATPNDVISSTPKAPRRRDFDYPPAGFYSSQMHRKVYEIRSAEMQ